MPEKAQGGLTKLELKIMQAVWKNGPCTVADVQQLIEPELAYTTVQTMLNILHRKGKLLRKLQGRAFQYRAKESEQNASRHALRDLVDRMFGGSAEELVMSLVKNKQVDAKLLATLAARIEQEGGVKK